MVSEPDNNAVDMRHRKNLPFKKTVTSYFAQCDSHNIPFNSPIHILQIKLHRGQTWVDNFYKDISKHFLQLHLISKPGFIEQG